MDFILAALWGGLAIADIFLAVSGGTPSWANMIIAHGMLAMLYLFQGFEGE